MHGSISGGAQVAQHEDLAQMKASMMVEVVAFIGPLQRLQVDDKIIRHGKSCGRFCPKIQTPVATACHQHVVVQACAHYSLSLASNHFESFRQAHDMKVLGRRLDFEAMLSSADEKRSCACEPLCESQTAMLSASHCDEHLALPVAAGALRTLTHQHQVARRLSKGEQLLKATPC